MKEIPITQGYVALVDDDNYERLSQYRWYLASGRYAARSGPRSKGEHGPVFMHHDVAGKPGKGLEIDHINRNTLDNQRSNLRVATRSQNTQNTVRPKRGKPKSSQFRGVYWDKTKKSWRVAVTLNRKRVFITCRTSEVEAARLYDKMARHYFGEFALLNFPDE